MNHQEYDQKKRECWEEYTDMFHRNLAARYVFDKIFDRAYALGKQEIKQEIKQETDAEGEEMLTVPRNKVQELYAKAKDIYDLYTNATCINSLESHAIDISTGKMKILDTLFGSKCLPDVEPKPAEPKFKVGDKVRYRCDGKIHEVKAKTGKYHYALSGLGHDAHEEYLELYTEPKENIAETRNFSQDCDKHFDNILKDSFAKERRLAIAAQMMQGLICAPLVPGVDPNPPAEYLAQMAFRLADALIAEWRKD